MHGTQAPTLLICMYVPKSTTISRPSQRLATSAVFLPSFTPGFISRPPDHIMVFLALHQLTPLKSFFDNDRPLLYQTKASVGRGFLHKGIVCFAVEHKPKLQASQPPRCQWQAGRPMKSTLTKKQALNHGLQRSDARIDKWLSLPPFLYPKSPTPCVLFPLQKDDALVQKPARMQPQTPCKVGLPVPVPSFHPPPTACERPCP